MEVRRACAQSTSPGTADFFTGAVKVKSLFQVGQPARLGGASVTFEPGARTAWHTHPMGQTLIVTDGAGWVQAWGGPVQELNVGDVVWTEPNEKHWHGARANSSMTHTAIQEALNGRFVQWMEKVDDSQYPSF